METSTLSIYNCLHHEIAMHLQQNWAKTVFNSLTPSDTIWRHISGSALAQAITWTNVDLPSVRSIGIHLSTILQDILQPSLTKISWKITFLKFLWNLLGANELMHRMYTGTVALIYFIDMNNMEKITM